MREGGERGGVVIKSWEGELLKRVCQGWVKWVCPCDTGGKEDRIRFKNVYFKVQ